MKEPTYVITYDVGTTGVKTCLFEIGEVVRLTAAAMRGYELYVLPDGGAEQEPPNVGSYVREHAGGAGRFRHGPDADQWRFLLLPDAGSRPCG